ncbi:hypothetical protein [Halomicronema sp. CCY15110]|uniref:nSTAND1 domain-containing NTPase n=1 Tax=Halomicronema sp. CCY15110 TaxID=2767773 RepID=UPI001951994E|nr:hypothetical protein [Halomicronema sp. CCY15110]
MAGDLDDYTGHAYTDAELLHHNQTALAELRNALQLAQGEFSLIALGCDYHRLRHLVNQDLVNAGLAAVLQLPQQFQNLREIIQQATADRPPPALVIVGLDYLTRADLQAVLHATNMGRDDLRQQFPFPIALWMNRRVRQQFLQQAPDSRSFSPAAIAFHLPVGELIHALKAGTQQLFNTILARGGDRELSSTSIRLIGSDALRSELEFAVADLTAQNVTPDPCLQASLDFLQGREAHSRLAMDTARDRYERSLAFWAAPADPEPSPILDAEGLTAADCRAVLWLHLGLWWRTYAVVQRATYDPSLRQARRYFEQLVGQFRDRDQTPHLARFIHVLAEVLQKQRDWATLETLANEGISLHQETHDPVRLARDHGFLAEVALIKEDWLTAQSEAAQALDILDTAEAELEDGETGDRELTQALAVAKRFQRGWYRFLLGEAQMHLSDPHAAIHYLEDARRETDPEVDLTLHLKVLEELIHHYFELGDYWEAFCVKQELRRVEYRYNLRAFIGAGAVQPHRHLATPTQFDTITEAAVAAEIRASGRLYDVEQLAQRLRGNPHAIVIVHGPSGVGKSSILTAGLVPMLRRQGSAIEGNPTIPLLIQTYGNWAQSLNAALDNALAPWFSPAASADDAPVTGTVLMGKLRQGVSKNRAFVLIFDQFEEFFFDKDDPQDRRQFYEFLGQCIDQPFVKVVLALREDYLHHLLEAETVINAASQMQDQDLLSRDQRYPLANFSPAAAEAVIRQLTSAAQYTIAEDLIHRLVADLAAETGDVRPIELQVVGAQLQRADINTLEQYAAIGDRPKQQLVQDYLTYVVRDCGPPNENLAWIVLYLLTDEDREQRLYRPLKTREELEYELALVAMPFKVDQLTMVVNILVGSGLVFEVPEEPEDRYQLVHDYLVRYVREEPQSRLMEALEKAQASVKAATAKAAEAKLERDKLGKANVRLKYMLVKGQSEWTDFKEEASVLLQGMHKGLFISAAFLIMLVVQLCWHFYSLESQANPSD